MWTKYRDDAERKRRIMLDDVDRYVFQSLENGDLRPPANAGLQPVIEAMWAQLARQNKVTKTFPTHD